MAMARVVALDPRWQQADRGFGVRQGRDAGVIAFDGLDDWLRERFFRRDGNADVLRRELASEHGIVIGLRSIELRVRHWRRELKAQKRATVRFETAPGHQMQIDFGDTGVWIGGERVGCAIDLDTTSYSAALAPGR